MENNLSMEIRKRVLDGAASAVLTDRNREYGEPEDSFKAIAALWEAYRGVKFSSMDVGVMLALMKVARIRTSGGASLDSFIDLAGYAACAAAASDVQHRNAVMEFIQAKQAQAAVPPAPVMECAEEKPEPEQKQKPESAPETEPEPEPKQEEKPEPESEPDPVQDIVGESSEDDEDESENDEDESEDGDDKSEDDESSEIDYDGSKGKAKTPGEMLMGRRSRDPELDFDAKIIALIKEGKATKEIASILHVGVNRVSRVRQQYQLLRSSAYR